MSLENPNNIQINKPGADPSTQIKKEENKIETTNRSLVYMKPNSWMLFQSLMFYNELYTYLYFWLEVFCFFVKGMNLIYPPGSYEIEILCLVFFVIFSYTRFYIGNLGNKSETSSFLVFFLIFAIVPAFSYPYFLCLQTYALKFEVLINCIGIVFMIAEFIFCLFTIITVSSQEKAL